MTKTLTPSIDTKSFQWKVSTAVGLTTSQFRDYTFYIEIRLSQYYHAMTDLYYLHII
jgi:hypothetical protein